MPKDSAKVRLPELPVFKKYSLALRQEFASVEEILSVLDRTTAKIRESIERADEERRRQELAPLPEFEVDDEDSIAAEETPEVDLGESERPFWEEPWEEDESTAAASTSSLAGRKTGSAPKAKAKAKTRRAKPSVVRVGHHGKPLTAKKAAPKKAAPKKAAPKKAAPKKAAPKKAAPKKKSVTKNPVSSRTKPKSRVGSRRK